MTELAKAVARSGALNDEMLREFNKWKLPIEVPEDAPFTTPEAAVAAIEEAMQGETQVEMRSTDLNILKQYLGTQRPMKLYLKAEHEDGTFDVSAGTTPLGEYILPWRSDSLTEVMTNGESYLLDGKRKQYIANVQELYFGEQKTFLLLTPIKETHGRDKD